MPSDKTDELWCCLCNCRHALAEQCPERGLAAMRVMWPGTYSKLEQDGKVKDGKYVE